MRFLTLRGYLAAGLLIAMAFCALALLACEPAPHVKRPPAKYQGDRTVLAVLTQDPETACRRLGALAEPGARIVACENNGAVVLVNPCLLPAGEDFAEDACHELGHANGWPGNHPPN